MIVAAPALAQQPPEGASAGEEHRPRIFSGGVTVPPPPEVAAARERGSKFMVRAQELYWAGDYGAAEAAFRTYLALQPHYDPPPQLVADHVGLRNGQWVLLSPRLLPPPPRPRAINSVLPGEILLAQGRSAEALQCYLACQEHTSCSALHYGMLIAFCRVRDSAGALTAYRRAGQRNPGARWLAGEDPRVERTVAGIEASALTVRGVESMTMSLSNAPRDLLAADRLAPRSATVSYWIGRVLRRQKQLPEAQRRFERAARLGGGEMAEDAAKQAKSIAAWLDQLKRIGPPPYPPEAQPAAR